MPDNNTPETPNVEVDAKALQDQIAVGVKAALTEMQQQTAKAQAEQYRQAQVNQASSQWANDPVAQTIAPYVVPVVQQLKLQADAANDKADFYLSHPDALEYKGELESQFNTLMTNGKAMERIAIWNHFKGANIDHFAKKMAEQQAANLNRAAQQSTNLGASAQSRPGTDESFYSLAPDKMKEAIGNAKF